MNVQNIKFAFLLLLSFVLCAGCGDPNRTRLIGNWGIESADRVMRRLGGEKGEGSPIVSQEGRADDSIEASNPPQTTPEATKFDATVPKMQIQFRANGELGTITEMGRVSPAPKQGHWKMLSFDATSRMMTVECTIGLQQSEHEIEFIDDNTIRLVPPNMAGLNLKLVFKRMDYVRLR